MSEKSPSEQLRNICAALEEDLNESPFTREEWDRLDAERLELLKANDSLAARLAEAERNEGTLLGMIHHQRDVLRECLPYINESMAGRRPGRCADDIRAAVKALTADSGDERNG